MKNSSGIVQGRGNSMEHTVGATEARRRFSELIDRVQYQGDFVIVLKNGKPAAVLVPIEWYERWKSQQGGEIADPEHTQ
jgi:prevent-host-death family protein